MIGQRTPGAWLRRASGRHERAAERLGERNVASVAGREVLAELPHPIEEWVQGVPGDAEMAPCVERGPPVVRGELTCGGQASQSAGNLGVDQLPRGKLFGGQ